MLPRHFVHITPATLHRNFLNIQSICESIDLSMTVSLGGALYQLVVKRQCACEQR